jgi:hypothetical protein
MLVRINMPNEKSTAHLNMMAKECTLGAWGSRAVDLISRNPLASGSLPLTGANARRLICETSFKIGSHLYTAECQATESFLGRETSKTYRQRPQS